MLMNVLDILDVLLTAYQGSLLLYALRKQCLLKAHSFLFETGAVFLHTLFIQSIQWFQWPVPDSLCILIPMVYISLLCRERISTGVLWALLDGVVFLGTLTLISSLFPLDIDISGNVVEGTNQARMLYLFFGNASITVTLNIVARIRKVAHEISPRETILFITMLLLCLVTNECFFSARSSDDADIVPVIGSACTFVVMLFTMILYDRMAFVARNAWRTDFSAKTQQMTSSYQHDLQNMYQQMLSQQHDIRHRITAAEEILAHSKISEEDRGQVMTLLQESKENRLYVTGFLSVDALLQVKSTVMQNANIAFSFREYPLTPLPISETDFCVLLGNILDNAIEGVMRLPDNDPHRSISLSFSRTWDILFIDCVNDADDSLIMKVGDDFLSTKDHPELHGFGTRSIREIAAQTGGSAEFEIRPGSFAVHVTLGSESP